MKRLLFLVSLFAALSLAAGCSSTTNSVPPTETKKAEPALSPSGPPVARVGGTVAMATPGLAINPEKRWEAVLKTEAGDITVELFPKEAPVHVNNFILLARSGYYNGVTFHRVLAGFMAQTGDPTGTGAGGPGWVIPDEISVLKHAGPGILSMAKTSAPNTGGSQFFITYDSTPWLDGAHTVFGKVIAGMDAVNRIRLRDPGVQPPQPPGTRITTIEIIER